MTDEQTEQAEALGYAAAIAELDGILRDLDDPDLDIDVLGDLVERALELIAACRARVDSATLRVTEIVADEGFRLNPTKTRIRGAADRQDLAGLVVNAAPAVPREEYDALNDTYARFLIEEMLPEVEKKYKLTDDPEKRAIGGTSSGAIAAFTVAWQRPDYFRRVISMIGSYTSIGYQPAADGKPMVPGGDLYPTLIRKNPIKPIRIYLQDGSADLSNEHGNWFLANQQMLSAFEYANAKADKDGTLGTRYEVKHNWGDGGHSDQHGGALLPEILRWIWTND